MDIAKTLRQLCPPAKLYLAISIFLFLLIAFQNLGKTSNTYCVGDYTCQVSNSPLLFVFKCIYILFWTWILHLICQSGYSSIAWFLVLVPIILMAIFIAFIFVYSPKDMEDIVKN